MKLFRRHPSNDRLLGIIFLIAGPLLAFFSLRDGNAWGAFLGGVIVMAGIGSNQFRRSHERTTDLEDENKRLREKQNASPAA